VNRVEFRILGPLEIADGERVLALGGAKRRAVAALLLLHANRVVAAEQLIDGVWGDEPPPSAAGSLQNHVLRLRRELGDRLVTQAPGYLIRTEPGELDLERFRRLVERARGAEPAEASDLLREALALWRGAPLADLAGEPAAAAAAHLGELRLEALERRIDADLARGRHAEVVPELEQLVAAEPFRERLRAQLMLALYRGGRQADALAAYAAARDALVEELGAEPAEELQSLQRAILRQDPSLGGPAEAPAPAVTSVEPARKTVTVVLGDLAAEGDDPEARRVLLRRLHDEADAVVARHGGQAGQTADDRVLGIFGVPAARDDDALRAVRAACDLRAAGTVARVGVATGDVITGDRARGEPLVSGPPLEEADRLRAGAAGAEVLVGPRTWRLVEHAVVAVARDGGHAVSAVVDDEAVVRRADTPFVGREDELDEILAAFRRAQRDGRARLVTVLGSPGVGKTRLSREAVERSAGTGLAVVGRTPAHGNAPAYAPLRDALAPLAAGSIRSWAAGVLADDPDGDAATELVAAAAGEAASTGPVEDTAWAVRRLLEALARRAPVLLVLEDLHWAAPVFLDLVEHLAALTRGPILVLALARPELIDVRPDWAGGRPGASTILLDSLREHDARALLATLTAGTPLTDERRTGILGAAGGNPLFMEQLVAAARDRDDAAIPDSIHALLATRLDALRDDERRVVQAAAVCGESFPASIVARLVGIDTAPVLRALAARDFVEPDVPRMPGEDRWAFRHVLLRDEAYASIPKRRRAELHEDVAAIVAALAAGSGLDVEEVVGGHLDAAYRARAEVDPGDPRLARLAREAAEHLAAAGRRAHDEVDMRGAARLLGRAAELLPPHDPARLAFALPLANALSWSGDREAAARMLADAEAAADPGDVRTRARVRALRLDLESWDSEESASEEVIAELGERIAELEALGDDEGLAYAYIALFFAHERSPVARRPGFELVKAAEHARAAGARPLESHAVSWLGVVARRGPWRVSEARRRSERVLADPPTRFARANAIGTLGCLAAMEGRFDEGRSLARESHELFADAGLPQTAAADLIQLADIEIIANEPAAADPILREAVDRLEALHDPFGLANAAWRLALACERRGDADEAARLVARARELNAGLAVEMSCLVVEAAVLARRGDPDRALAALDAADRAVEGVVPTGLVADTLVQAAEAAVLAGAGERAAAYLRSARDLAASLEYSVAESRASARLAELGHPAATR
jgi:DNA-binding SARP family transcriptional activator